MLSWNPVSDAVEYQIFEYNWDTGLVRMLDRTTTTSYAAGNYSGSSYGYIVQPISYTAICDNVSAEYAVKPGEKQETTEPSEPSKPAKPAEPSEAAGTVAASGAYNSDKNRMTISWDAVDGAESYYVYRYYPGKKTLSKPRVVDGRTSCSYRSLKSGAVYYFVVSTEEITDRRGYNGDYSVKIDIPKF